MLGTKKVCYPASVRACLRIASTAETDRPLSLFPPSLQLLFPDNLAGGEHQGGVP